MIEIVDGNHRWEAWKSLMKIRIVPIGLIRPNPENRPVDRNSFDYEILKESIQKHGILNHLYIQKVPGNTYYVIIDGHYRYAVCQELGITSLPCYIVLPDC